MMVTLPASLFPFKITCSAVSETTEKESEGEGWCYMALWDNGISIKFIPSPSISSLRKQTCGEVVGSKLEETALCANCHASPPTLTRAVPFVVCPTCKLSRACCHMEKKTQLLRNEKEKTSPPVRAEKSDGQAFRNTSEEHLCKFLSRTTKLSQPSWRARHETSHIP